MSSLQEILNEAARSALQKFNLVGQDMETAIALVSSSAATSVAVQKQFSYALTDKAYIAKGSGKAIAVGGAGMVGSEVMPSLRMPNVVRVRQRKISVTINYNVSPRFMEFLTTNYARDVKIEFLKDRHHDHPEAAASKKIESEVLMARLLEMKADLLRPPANGYDYSVRDCGGDWRLHQLRKHYGVHVDAPILDDRDASRDARKRMQLCEDFPQSAVCRNKSQDCNVTAPFGMSCHAITYFMKCIDVCQMMASTGMMLFTFSMHLPEELDDMQLPYRDPHYGYVIEDTTGDIAQAALYLPPQLRKGLNKFVFPRDKSRTLRYRYPAGESREYEHDMDDLVSWLRPNVYSVITSHRVVYRYEYTVVRRVGSLLYGEIRFLQEEPPAHTVQMAMAVSRPLDGYRVFYDENLVQDFSVTVARAGHVDVTRQFFDPIAMYCLSKVRDKNFSVSSAVSYGRSVASNISANGVSLHNPGRIDSYVVVVIAAVAAYLWAYDRYRLMEARLPSLNVSEMQNAVNRSLSGSIGDSFNISQMTQALKTAASSFASSRIAEFALTKSTTYGDLKQVYEAMANLSTPGVAEIKDLFVHYPRLRMLDYEPQGKADTISSDIVVTAVEPSWPIYETVHDLEKLEGRVTRQLDDGSTLVSAGEFEEADEELPTRHASVVRLDKQERRRPDFVRYVIDMIDMTVSAQSEKTQTAFDCYKSIFNPETRRVRDITIIRGTMIGTPTVLHYVSGILAAIVTLEQRFVHGTAEYDEKMQLLKSSRCIYPEARGMDEIGFGTGVLRQDGVFVSDRRYRTSDQSFDAVVDSTLRVVNAYMLEDLRKEMSIAVDELNVSTAVLENGVAGCGKTYSQCVFYKQYTEAKRSVAIFASTAVAAQQATERLTLWKVPIAPNSISTVDSFLMNQKNWKKYELVLVDEALQLHAGKLFAMAYVTGAELRGYGDEHQVGYIPFTRYHTPTVNTNFPWAQVKNILLGRRNPRDKRLLAVLRDPVDFYGPEYDTNPESKLAEALCLYSTVDSIEGINLSKIYALMGIDSHEELLIMVSTQDEAFTMRGKLHLERSFPGKVELSDGHVGYKDAYPCCLKTSGESQGDDVPHSLFIRTLARQMPLYDDKHHATIVLTRHKKRFGFLAVKSEFPTLIQRHLGIPKHLVSYNAAEEAWLMVPVFKGYVPKVYV